MRSDDVPAASLLDAADAIRDGSTTSSKLTAAALARADEIDPLIGVYINRCDETALAAAEQADADFARGIDRGPLQGIPIGIKDILATKDAPTTAQSLVLDPDWGNGEDAVSVERLRRAGAVIVGKTTTMEFAHGLPDPDSPFPLPRNPWNLERWAGGSSSGSASGVATGLFFAGIGTDTGGSIRAPAAYCGITGFKPTYGLVPTAGCVENSPTMDHVGPLARTARDCAAVFDALVTTPSGEDRPGDQSASLEIAPGRPLRIAVERSNHSARPGVLPDVCSSFEEAVAAMQACDAAIEEIQLPSFEIVANGHSITSMAEKFACHSTSLGPNWSTYGRYTRLMSAQGAFVGAADYLQAQRVRTWARLAYQRRLDHFDVLLVPTMAGTAPELSALSFTSLQSGHISFTGVWSFLGFPAAAVPMGFSSDGLPMSLQIVGKPYMDATVLRAAALFQSVTDWHEAIPPAESWLGGQPSSQG